jgi:endonuclease YncB( thermonuclease family)
MGFKKRLFIFLLIILLLALLAYYYPYLTGMFVSNNNINYPKEPAILLRVIDGDTIEVDLNDSKQTIRLLGINNTII